MGYEDFTKMPVWQQSFEFLVRIYKTTKNYPSDERFGFISDMRRSANPIAHNFAEGFGRFSAESPQEAAPFGEPRDKTRFYPQDAAHKISRGSMYELVNQLLVSFALSFINKKNKKYFS